MTTKNKLFDWVKKLGQWHVNDSGGTTVCGMPMLGNNYSKDIPIENREPCEKCMSKYPDHYRYFNVCQIVAREESYQYSDEEVDKMVQHEEREIEDGQARWAETGSSRRR